MPRRSLEGHHRQGPRPAVATDCAAAAQPLCALHACAGTCAGQLLQRLVVWSHLRGSRVRGGRRLKGELSATPPHPSTPPAGSHLALVMFSGMLLQLLLLPCIAVQALSVAAALRADGGVCTSPLLAHSLTAGRIRAFHRVMYQAAMLLPGECGAGLPSSDPLSRRSLAGGCANLLTHSQLPPCLRCRRAGQSHCATAAGQHGWAAMRHLAVLPLPGRRPPAARLFYLSPACCRCFRAAALFVCPQPCMLSFQTPCTLS